jgi:Saxitoxin biosynthesis operon protein SxtJ
MLWPTPAAGKSHHMGRTAATHENFSAQREVGGASDRGFGLVFAAVFGLIALAPLRHGGSVRLGVLAIAAAFLILALIAPRTLSPLNRLWLRFGLLLHKVISPVVMAFLFFAVVTPVALIIRWIGRDPLRLTFEPGADSYWIERQPPGPAPDTMRNQF